MNRRLLLFVGWLVALTGCGKIVVLPVTPGMKDEGVFYALPKTVARVGMKVDREVKQGAPYAMFRPIFAPDAASLCGTISQCRNIDAKTGKPAPAVEYSVQKATTFATFGEPDPDQVFLVKFKGSGAVDQALSMGWNEAGLLSTASASVTNRTTDIALSALKAATGLGIKAASGAIAAKGQDAAKCPTGEAIPGWIVTVLGQFQSDITTNPLIANYCELPATNRDPSKDEDSRDDYGSADAQLLNSALGVYQRRVAPFVQARTDLLIGPNNTLAPGQMIEKLDVLIAEQLGAWFIGAESKKTWELPFEVRSLDPARPVRLIGLNKNDGVCPVTALLAYDAKAKPSGFATLPDARCQQWVSLSVGYAPTKSTQLFERVRSSVTPPTGDRSFRYVLPAQVKAVVGDGADEYGAGLFSVAQLGHVVSLPAERNSKTLSYDLTMIEATGGLKAFKLGTTGGVDAATIDALAGVGGSVLDARNTRRTAAEKKQAETEEAADEVNTLTRERTLLKLKDEICELQKKYGLACTTQP